MATDLMTKCKKTGAGSKIANHLCIRNDIRKEFNVELTDVQTNRNKVVVMFDHGK